MTGFDRYNSILILFSEQKSSWTVAEMAKTLGTPSSTIYRIVRELVAAGSLESAAGSHYRLGPAFIAFDRTISRTDPLVRSGIAFLDALADQNPIPSATVLARLYGTKVMCVADSRSPSFKSNTSYQPRAAHADHSRGDVESHSCPDQRSQVRAAARSQRRERTP